MTFSYWSFMHFITSNNDSISRTQEERGETAVTGWPTELGLRDIYEISMNSYHHIMWQRHVISSVPNIDFMVLRD